MPGRAALTCTQLQETSDKESSEAEAQPVVQQQAQPSADGSPADPVHLAMTVQGERMICFTQCCAACCVMETELRRQCADNGHVSVLLSLPASPSPIVVDSESEEESEVFDAEQLKAIIDGMDKTNEDGDEVASSR